MITTGPIPVPLTYLIWIRENSFSNSTLTTQRRLTDSESQQPWKTITFCWGIHARTSGRSAASLWQGLRVRGPRTVGTDDDRFGRVVVAALRPAATSGQRWGATTRRMMTSMASNVPCWDHRWLPG